MSANIANQPHRSALARTTAGLLLAPISCALHGAEPAATTRIVIAGDSTASFYATDRFPRMG
jgi:hypothetical protein